MWRRRKRCAIALTAIAFIVLSIVLLLFKANSILKYEIERALGRNFSIESISLGLRGVDVYGVRFARGGKIVFKADRVAVKASLPGFLRHYAAASKETARRYEIADLVLVKPFLRVETDRRGNFINPLDLPENSGNAKNNGSLLIRKLTIMDGSLAYFDGKITTTPHLTKLESVNGSLTDLALPFESNWSQYTISAGIPGRSGAASLRWSGRSNCKTLDTDAHISLAGLDITGFKPYYRKQGDADITRGSLSIDMSLHIKSRVVNAPGRAVLKDLEFAPGKGLGDTFIGVPRSLVLKLLKSGNNEIALDFTIAGDVSDPRFNMTESFVRRMTVGLARNLGLTVVDAGKSVVELGAKGVQEVGKGVRSIGSGIQGLFRK